MPRAPKKPATQNAENEQQHHDMCHSYWSGPGECEQAIKKDKYENNSGEKKTRFPRHLVANKMCGELHEPRIGDQTHRYQTQPWDDHKQNNSKEKKMSYRERERASRQVEGLQSAKAGLGRYLARS